MTIKVVGTFPYVYYTLNSNALDNVSKLDGALNPYSLNLSVFGSAGIVYSASGKIGYCLQKKFLQTLYNESNPITSTWQLEIKPDLSSAPGFTIRLWAKFTVASSRTLIFGYGPTSIVLPSFILEVSGGVVNWRVLAKITGLGTTYTASVGGTGIQDGNWHMVVARYTAGTPNKISIQVDDGTLVETNMGVGKSIVWDAVPGIRLFDNGAGTDVLLDEIAIYKGHVLTSSEATAEWVGGKGRTWNGTTWIDGP